MDDEDADSPGSEPQAENLPDASGNRGIPLTAAGFVSNPEQTRKQEATELAADDLQRARRRNFVPRDTPSQVANILVKLHKEGGGVVWLTHSARGVQIFESLGRLSDKVVRLQRRS